MKRIGALLLLAPACAVGRWEETQTEHLTIHYRPGSHAERHLDEVRRDFEAAYLAVFDQVPFVPEDPAYDVYLHEYPSNFGWSNLVLRRVHYRYDAESQLTSPHEFIHIVLHDLNPDAPGRLDEGICRVREARTITANGETQVCELYRLAWNAPADVWDLDAIFARGYSGDDEGNTAAACVKWLQAELGEDAFWELYLELDRSNYRELLEERAGRSWAELKRAFLAFRDALEPPPPFHRRVR